MGPLDGLLNYTHDCTSITATKKYHKLQAPRGRGEEGGRVRIHEAVGDCATSTPFLMVPREERADKGKWFHDEVSGELWGRQRIENEWTGKNNGSED